MSAISELVAVVEMINNLVSRDGGSLTFDGYDEEAGILRVGFSEGVNDKCDTCTINAGMAESFLRQSLQSHGLQVEEIVLSQRP